MTLEKLESVFSVLDEEFLYLSRLGVFSYDNDMNTVDSVLSGLFKYLRTQEKPEVRGLGPQLPKSILQLFGR